MNKKIVLLIFFAINTIVNSQQFQLIDDTFFIAKIEFNNKILGFNYDNFLQFGDFVSTDGTIDGTIVLRENLSDIGGYYSLKGLDWVIYNNEIYLSGEDSNGMELWKTDGTPTGTFMLKDILPQDGNLGTQSGTPQYFKNYNGKFYFSGKAPKLYDYTFQIWESDGTADGTQILKILPYSNLGYPNEVIPDPCKYTVFNNLLYFQAYGNEIWNTNGTEVGTMKIKNIGFGHRIISEIIPFQDKLLFFTYNYFNNVGSKYNLWVSDGTTEGTFVLKQMFGVIYRAEGNIDVKNSQTSFLTFNNKLYYLTSEGLNVTDGTNEGTMLVKNINPTYGGYGKMTIFNNKILFTHDYDIWESNGTEEGTKLIKNFNTYIKDIRVSNNIFYFLIYNFDFNYPEVWSSNGTNGGTIKLGSPVTTPNTISEHFSFTYNNDFYCSSTTPNSNSPQNKFWKISALLDIDNHNHESKFLLYPNPANNLIYFNSKVLIKKTEIYNSLGQLVLSRLSVSSFDISSLNKGLYFIKIEDIYGNSETKKLIKQ